MTHDDQLEHHYWRIAELVCTYNELVALRLRNTRHLGTRRIALTLGIDRRTVRDRLNRADQKIANILTAEQRAKETAA